MISQRLYSDELIGRREELQFLTEEFRAASHAGVRLLTIEGEAEIGKFTAYTGTDYFNPGFPLQLYFQLQIKV